MEIVNHLQSAADQMSQDIVRLKKAQRQVWECKRSSTRGAVDWKRNQKLQIAACMRLLGCEELLLAAVCQNYLQKELVSMGSERSLAAVSLYLNRYCNNEALNAALHRRREADHNDKIWRKAAQLLCEARAVPDLAAASSKGINWTSETHDAQD